MGSLVSRGNEMSIGRILNTKWQQRIKNKDIVKRTDTNINIAQRMMESKN